MEQIRQKFNDWDADGNGEISADELHEVLVQLGVPSSAVSQLFGAADLNKDGKLDFDEFLEWMFADALDQIDKAASTQITDEGVAPSSPAAGGCVSAAASTCVTGEGVGTPSTSAFPSEPLSRLPPKPALLSLDWDSPDGKLLLLLMAYRHYPSFDRKNFVAIEWRFWEGICLGWSRIQIRQNGAPVPGQFTTLNSVTEKVLRRAFNAKTINGEPNQIKISKQELTQVFNSISWKSNPSKLTGMIQDKVFWDRFLNKYLHCLFETHSIQFEEYLKGYNGEQRQLYREECSAAQNSGRRFCAEGPDGTTFYLNQKGEMLDVAWGDNIA